MILVIDTETTGKYNFKLPHDHSSQPNLVQLGFQVLSEDGPVRHQAEFVIRPDGWVISDEVAQIHGITNNIAAEQGVDIHFALDSLAGCLKSVDRVVAHNVDFDLAVMATAYGRCFRDDVLAKLPRFCTMKAMTPVMQLPGPYGNKWPKLSEAYAYCTDTPLVNAHCALVDVAACATVYRWYWQNAARHDKISAAELKAEYA